MRTQVDYSLRHRSGNYCVLFNLANNPRPGTPPFMAPLAKQVPHLPKLAFSPGLYALSPCSQALSHTSARAANPNRRVIWHWPSQAFSSGISGVETKSLLAENKPIITWLVYSSTPCSNETYPVHKTFLACKLTTTSPSQQHANSLDHVKIFRFRNTP